MFSNKLKRGILLTVLVLTVAIIVAAVYVENYYRADEAGIAAFLEATDAIYESQEGFMTFGEEDSKDGFVFYPGGKVEYTAYVPLMEQLASDGLFCVLVEMPFNLAVLDIDAAEEIIQQYPQVEHWYIGGHSLGGSMAADYASRDSVDFEGLVLLGAYSTADITEKDIQVLSVYGSEDKVMNRDKYEEYKVNLPEDMTELIIEGGCHAYFGMYGLQEGDGIPAITNEKQIEITAGAISDMIEVRNQA